MTKVIACPITVAMAAPFTPILKAKIKSGSKIRFAIAPARVLWALSFDNGLPRTSQQYIIDVEKPPELFKELVEW